MVFTVPTHEIYEASSLFQVVALCAAIDSGVVSDPGRLRTLVLCTNAPAPELAAPLEESQIVAEASSRFTYVVSLNTLLYPLAPRDFSPRARDMSWVRPLLSSYLGVGPGADVVLYLESLQSDPGLALARVFWDSKIVVHADGLMVYGPSRTRFPASITQRVSGILYPQFVPGLEPLLLREASPRHIPLPLEDLKATVAGFLTEVTEAPVPGEPYALVLGQYLSALGVLEPAEEYELSARMIAYAHERTELLVVFKPHPSAPEPVLWRLREFAESRGIRLHVARGGAIAEFLFHAYPPDLVVSSFSTALATAQFGYGIPVAALGTDLLLERLTPYENSNRVPVTIADALMGVDGAAQSYRERYGLGPGTSELSALINAVAYACQPDLNPDLAEGARSFASWHMEGLPHTAHKEPQPAWRRYIKLKRARAAGIVAQAPSPSTARDLRGSRWAIGAFRQLKRLSPARRTPDLPRGPSTNNRRKQK